MHNKFETPESVKNPDSVAQLLTVNNYVLTNTVTNADKFRQSYLSADYLEVYGTDELDPDEVLAPATWLTCQVSGYDANNAREWFETFNEITYCM